MRLVRWLLWMIGIAAVAVLVTRAVLFGVAAPFLFWRLFRESGYPWWIQVPAAVAWLPGSPTCSGPERSTLGGAQKVGLGVTTQWAVASTRTKGW